MWQNAGFHRIKNECDQEPESYGGKYDDGAKPLIFGYGRFISQVIHPSSEVLLHLIHTVDEFFYDSRELTETLPEDGCEEGPHNYQHVEYQSDNK